MIKSYLYSFTVSVSFYLNRFTHLYTSNHNTDTEAILAAIPNSPAFNPLKWKKLAKGSIYNMANSMIRVKPLTAANKMFLFLKLSNRL